MGKVMEYKGYKAKIMEAPRLTGDMVHGLPPGTPLEVYPVESFKAPPENWVKTGAFVVPVRPNFGLWFDWRGNSATNTAVSLTIKGVSPVTGVQTSGFHLEKYEDKCPKHNKPFIGDRFCEECGYKWAPQSYISAPNTLWWDGWFNQKDGTVRQFFFTEDELRDVATSLIGSEKVPAFGFAFYSPKERRPEVQTMRGDSNSTVYHLFKYGNVTCDSFIPQNSGSNGYFSNSLLASMKTDGPEPPLKAVYCNSVGSIGNYTPTASCSVDDYGTIGGSSIEEKTSGSILNDRSRQKTKSLRSFSAPVKEVSVGAGAKINQNLSPDPYGLDTWKETPDSVMTIYFVFQEKFNEIAAGGFRDMEGSKEGFLSNVVVG